MTRLPFEKVLIANRGEIALRIVRTLRALGLRSVAVYSDADADHRHVLEADEAVSIGPAEARASYLRVDALLAAARSSGADAVHPGYGFLSEDARFAEAVHDAGLVFIGPPADVLAASSDKLTVKRLVAKAGVPVIPGPLEVVPDDGDALLAIANELGYPLLLKAARGGGGKGMREVHSEAELLPGAEAARREAGGAFGDAELYVERILQHVRHVEVQVLADDTGHVVVLGERDCSVQRRHQKVLEETPAPGLDDDLRRRIHEAGAAAARALGYRNAGTVEFLLDEDGRFHFLEMNRRLQVEHPVSEAVLGLDLVAWQLRLAAGEPLPREPDAFLPRGHAIEARVYAEDPARGFLPSSGKILALREPEGPGTRVDSALAVGMEVTSHYDPLLAKVIAHGQTREEALRRLDLALAETVVLGLRTNVGFLRRLLAHEDFRAGRLRTDFIDRASKTLCDEPPPTAPVILAAAAHLLLPRTAPGHGASSNGGAPRPSPWATLRGFRLSNGGGG